MEDARIKSQERLGILDTKGLPDVASNISPLMTGDMVLLEKQPDVQLIVGIKAWPAQQEAGSSGHHWAMELLRALSV